MAAHHHARATRRIPMSTKYCKHCGQHKPLTDFYYTRGLPFARCKACVIAYRRAGYLKNPARDHAKTRARLLKDPRVRMAAAARRRDRMKGLDSDIQAEQITIPKTCPVLGIPLTAQAGKLGPGSPSIDHIDPARGAVWGNWKVISNRANLLKADHTAASLADYIDRVENPGRYPGGRKVVLRGLASLGEYREVLRYIVCQRAGAAPIARATCPAHPSAAVPPEAPRQAPSIPQ
jgi:hypothetical protein